MRAGLQAYKGDDRANNRSWSFLFSLSKVCILKISQKITEKGFLVFFLNQLLTVANIVITAFRRGMTAGGREVCCFVGFF